MSIKPLARWDARREAERTAHERKLNHVNAMAEEARLARWHVGTQQ